MAKPPLQAAVISDGGLHNLDEMDDRVKLVDMLDGASDAACLAVLHRLDALPVPIKSIIKLVAKKLARVRKHETRAVADAAGLTACGGNHAGCAVAAATSVVPPFSVATHTCCYRSQ